MKKKTLTKATKRAVTKVKKTAKPLIMPAPVLPRVLQTPLLPHQFSQKGKWVFKPLRSKIALCTCGNKFVPANAKQISCLFCMWNKTNRSDGRVPVEVYKK